MVPGAAPALAKAGVGGHLQSLSIPFSVGLCLQHEHRITTVRAGTEVHSLEGCQLCHGRSAAILPGAGAIVVPSDSTDFGGEQKSISTDFGCSAASCQASVQAGRYDKWEVRKEIEEEIKSVRLACPGGHWQGC